MGRVKPEPIAWLVYTLDSQSAYVTTNPADIKEGQRALPLYTGPRPLKRWSEAQHERAYRNSPELHKDVPTLAAFKRVAKAVAAMYGIEGSA